MSDQQLAGIFQGQLYLLREDGGQVLESQFGRSLRDRAIQSYNRNLWKTQGRGGQSLSRALHTPAERDPSDFRIAITSVTRGRDPGQLLYTLETDEISGVFSRDAAGVEQRLFHTADFRARHLDVSPDGCEIATSVHHRNGMANLAVLRADGSDLNEVTDGESVDEAPRWVPGPGRRLVFQSAGMPHGPRGRAARLGPSSLQELDLDTGKIACLAQAADFDFLWPRIASDGTLYYILRPYAGARPPVTGWDALRDTVMLPFRIIWWIGMLAEAFASIRAGRQVPAPRESVLKVAATPSSWLLMRQPAQGAAEAETIASGVRSFDLSSDGSLIYSDGFDVYRIPADHGPAAKILAGENIDLIAAL